MVAHITVIENSGQFTSPISATGDWRVSAVLYERGKRIDSCTTGTVRWAAGTIAAGAASPLIVPANGSVDGLTYAYWEAIAWQWDLANLRSHHSVAPIPLPCATRGQQGPVWFLSGDSYDYGTSFAMTCQVPAGRYLLIDVPSVDCSTAERAPFHASTDAGLLRCASAYRLPTVSLAIDGNVVSPAAVSSTTPVFAFTMPATGNLLGVPGATHGRAAVVGRGIMLAPLPPGHHTVVHVTRTAGGELWSFTYQLNVS